MLEVTNTAPRDDAPRGAVAFDNRHSYIIGVMRPGHTPDAPDAELQHTGRFKAKKLLGSQLIGNGVRNIDELFRDNPFGLTEGQTYDVFELNVDTESRRYMGGGTVLPKPKAIAATMPATEPAAAVMTAPAVDHVTPSLADGGADADARTVIPLFESQEREARREETIGRVHRNMIDTLREELTSRDDVIERAHRIAEQALTQNERVLDRIDTALERLTETTRQKEELSGELAQVRAQIDAILQIREFEERIRSERESERRDWEERERQLQDRAAEGRGLGDAMESFLPFLPLAQMILERLLPPAGAMRPGMMPGALPPGAMPPGAMPPGAMPPGAMPGMTYGTPGMTYGGSFGMPPGAMPLNAMPPGTMPGSGFRYDGPPNGAPQGNQGASTNSKAPNGSALNDATATPNVF